MNRLILCIHFCPWSVCSPVSLALRLGAAGSVVANASVHSIIHDACFIHGLALPTEWILSPCRTVDWSALALVVADYASSDDT